MTGATGCATCTMFAVGVCADCGNAQCGECGVRFDGNFVCRNCRENRQLEVQHALDEEERQRPERERQQLNRIFETARELASKLAAAQIEPELTVCHSRGRVKNHWFRNAEHFTETSDVYAAGWVIATDTGWITRSFSSSDSRVGSGEASAAVLVVTLLGTDGTLQVVSTNDVGHLPLKPQDRQQARADRELWKPWNNRGVGTLQPEGSFGDGGHVITVSRPDQMPLPPLSGDSKGRPMPFPQASIEAGLAQLAAASFAPET